MPELKDIFSGFSTDDGLNDTDTFTGQKSDGTFFKTAWSNVKAKLKTYFDNLYQSILSEGAFVDGDKTKLDGIESGAEVNDVDSVAGKTGAVSLDFTDLSDTTIMDGADGDIPTLESGVWVNKSKIEAGLEDALVLKIKTDNTGASNNNQFTFPAGDFGSPDYDVDWGDGIITRGHTNAVTHTYDTAGTYIIKIVGNVAHFGFNGGGDKDKLLEVMNWGAIRDYARFYYTFFGCANMQITANDVPNLNNLEIPALFRVFRNATLFNQDISNWNVSEIINISQIFDGASSFNQDISSWDVSSVINYFRCFFNASSFDQDLSDWALNTSLTNLIEMFSGSGMSKENYNKWLISRANLVTSQGAPYNVDMSGQSGMTYDDTVYAEFSGETYDDAVSARAFLVGGTANWTITGDTDVS